MIKKSFIFILASLFISSFSMNNVQALTPPKGGIENNTLEVSSAYRKYKDITVNNILVPTVVEVPFDDKYLERSDFAILDIRNNSFLPYYYKKEISSNKIPYTVSTQPVIINAYKIADNKNDTYAEFEYIEKNEKNIATIKIIASQPITASAFVTLFDANVAMPNFVQVKAVVGGRDKIILANTKMYSSTVKFPVNISKEWEIQFSYGQPLRINEIRLIQSDLKSVSSQALRFLAQPGHGYRVYFDPDRSVSVKTSELGNLVSNEDVLMLAATNEVLNPGYKISDIDKDGHPDITDNCINTANPDQNDINNNGRGDICDDFDKDGIMNDKDNCPNLPNRSQIDTDRDGMGDECDIEESRLTEKYKWIPWAGIVFALLVIIILFFITARSKPEDNLPPSQ